jgi:hypothetical protein
MEAAVGKGDEGGTGGDETGEDADKFVPKGEGEGKGDGDGETIIGGKRTTDSEDDGDTGEEDGGDEMSDRVF